MKDPVAMVEAAYRLEGSEEQWLSLVLDAMLPSFPAGVGGFFFDRSAPSGNWIWGATGFGAARRALDALPVLYGGVSDELRMKLMSGPPVLMLSESFRVLNDDVLHRFAAQVQLRDALSIAAADPTGRGCILGAPINERLRFDARSKQAWARVAAHVSAGLRLRRTLEERAPELPEAVLRPDGKLEHADGRARGVRAREVLRDAVRSMELARTRLRREDPDAALEIWRALTAGRWSLVDRFEENGRRFVVALKNEACAPDPRRLTARERTVAGYIALGRSNKLIAYSMGVSEGTVAALVSRVMRKLGARGRADCARILSELSAAPGRAVSSFELAGNTLCALSAPADEAIAGLTLHEHCVARAAAQGRTNADIGLTLDCSPRTVANTLARIYRKTRVGSRAELASLLVQRR